MCDTSNSVPGVRVQFEATLLKFSQSLFYYNFFMVSTSAAAEMKEFVQQVCGNQLEANVPAQNSDIDTCRYWKHVMKKMYANEPELG